MDTYDLQSAQSFPADTTLASSSVPDLGVAPTPPGTGQTVIPAPAAASRTGQMVIGGGTLRIHRAANLLVLTGDIDETTQAGLAAALDDLADEPGDVHVGLAGVEFCGVAGLRAFVLLSRARHQDREHHGRRVILHHSSAQLRNLLQILGWDTTPGLVIGEFPELAS